MKKEKDIQKTSVVRRIMLRLEGTTPILLHCNQTADPLNIYARVMKQMNAKPSTKRTDQDHFELSRVEWEAGLYLDDEGKVTLPGTGIEAAIKSAAKLSRNAQDIKKGVHVEEMYCDFQYAGVQGIANPTPKTPEDVPTRSLDAAYEDHHDRRLAKNGTSTIVRTRPRFNEWAVEFTVLYDDAIITERTLLEILQNGGRYCGLFDYRERYGKYEVKVIR